MAKSDEWHDDLAGRVTVVETLIDDIPNRTRKLEMSMTEQRTELRHLVSSAARRATLVGVGIGTVITGVVVFLVTKGLT